MAEGSAYSSDQNTTGHELRDKVGEQFDRVAGNVEGIAKSVAERGREAGENVQAVAGNINSAVNASVKDHPMTTLAFAAVMGFVLGAVWKS